jgi:glutamate dehydrogenase
VNDLPRKQRWESMARAALRDELLSAQDVLTGQAIDLAGKGLTRPELAVVLAHTKIALKEWMRATDLPEDPYRADRLRDSFPDPLPARFPDLLGKHRLSREIITTVAVNRFVDSQGITGYYRLSGETGAGVADVIRAQLAARSIYAVGRSEVLLGRIEGLDATLATDLRLELRRMVERGARWLLHNRPLPLDIQAALDEFTAPVAAVRENLFDFLTPMQQAHVKEKYDRWIEAGAPEELARALCVAGYSHFALGIANVSNRLGKDPKQVAAVHRELTARVSLDVLDRRVNDLPRKQRWESMARAALRDELLSAQDGLTGQAIELAGKDISDPVAVVDAWTQSGGVRRRAALIEEITSEPADLARASVALGQVRGLVAK